MYHRKNLPKVNRIVEQSQKRTDLIDSKHWAHAQQMPDIKVKGCNVCFPIATRYDFSMGNKK